MDNLFLSSVLVLVDYTAKENMDMKSQESNASRERSIANALRAIEVQRANILRHSTNEQATQRSRLFNLLDQLNGTIFTSIENAVRENERSFMLNSVPGFATACNDIFGRGLGIPNTDMLNDWLHARDLTHVFYATPGATLNW